MRYLLIACLFSALLLSGCANPFKGNYQGSTKKDISKRSTLITCPTPTIVTVPMETPLREIYALLTREGYQYIGGSFFDAKESTDKARRAAQEFGQELGACLILVPVRARQKDFAIYAVKVQPGVEQIQNCTYAFGSYICDYELP